MKEYSIERTYLHDVELVDAYLCGIELDDVYLCGIELDDVSEQLKSILLEQNKNEG